MRRLGLGSVQLVLVQRAEGLVQSEPIQHQRCVTQRHCQVRDGLGRLHVVSSQARQINVRWLALTRRSRGIPTPAKHLDDSSARKSVGHQIERLANPQTRRGVHRVHDYLSVPGQALPGNRSMRPERHGNDHKVRFHGLLESRESN